MFCLSIFFLFSFFFFVSVLVFGFCLGLLS
uniref:Uncharacterized protein n=1 Tax=Rhizophora mucronata TaxID=61149 RepID=A0A2P2IHP8_RHIMU